ncbi:MAG: hypothetical protein OEV41_12155 [Gammaproteobacteria bacterium]|jgi:hypothetical protein|nr:hypothetical protein [Gammaproteobacteria bacterium]
MQPAGLHWFRRKQRTLSRAVLAAFCLAWLQFASVPCVMALDSASRNLAASTVGAATPMAQMPDGMVMAPGEHCRYCPSPQPEPGGGDPAVCSFPHDPQVDLRVGFAAALLGPPPSSVLFVIADAAASASNLVAALTPAPVPGTSLAVSFCRFLK